MRRFASTLAAVALLIAAAAPASAQDYPAAVGWGGGMAKFSDLSTTGPQDLQFESGWIVNAHVERWPGSQRIGLKLAGAMTERPLNVGTAFTVGNIRTWMTDLTVLLRLLPASAGNSVAPYIGGGIGLVSYQLGTGPRVAFTQASAEYSGHDENQFAAVATAGVDILPGIHWGFQGVQSIGFRLEGVDRIALNSPFEEANGGGAFGPVHNLQISLSIFSGIDWLF